MKIRSLVVCLVVAAVCVPVWAQTDFSKVEITAIEVADGIYMLQGAGGNIGVSAGQDGIFLIDDQYAPLTEKIVAAVRSIDERPIRFVLNTHWHGDHTGGNENLGKTGALIVAHDNVRKQMTVDHVLKLWDVEVPASPAGALPVVTFSDSVTFHINGEELHAFHVETAHTDGDAMVHFRNADVLHMGDVFFNGIFPFIDVWTGGSIDGMIAACDLALEMVTDSTRIIPGHGPLADREDLVVFRDMLRQVEASVAPLIRQGRSLEEVQAADPLAPLLEDWGGGFLSPEQFLAVVYEGMSNRP